LTIKEEKDIYLSRKRKKETGLRSGKKNAESSKEGAGKSKTRVVFLLLLVGNFHEGEGVGAASRGGRRGVDYFFRGGLSPRRESTHHNLGGKGREIDLASDKEKKKT